MTRVLTEEERTSVLKKEKLCFSEAWEVKYWYKDNSGIMKKDTIMLYTLNKGNKFPAVKEKAKELFKHLKNFEIICITYQ